jgi:hypothetical protein
MRVLMTEDSNNPVSNSFLLDDDSRWPSLCPCQLFLCYYTPMPSGQECLRLTCVCFEMQHTILCRWYIQINGADWHLWYWTASTDSRELWLCILVAAAWIVACCECQLWYGMQVPRTTIGRTMQCEILKLSYAQWMSCTASLLASTFAAFQIGFVLKSSSWSQVFVACLDSPSVDL